MMHIALLFHFYNEAEPAAVTEVKGEVTDMMVPLLGDTVSHRGFDGFRFRAQVVGRHFDYSLANGVGVDGTITVTLSLHRISEVGAGGLMPQ